MVELQAPAAGEGRDAALNQRGWRCCHAQSLVGVLSIAVGVPELKSWAAEQRRALTADLLVAQNCDGAWTGACPGSFEDDPLLSTALALRTLAADA